MKRSRQRLKYIISDLIAVALGWTVFYVYRYDVTGYLTHPSLEAFMTYGRVVQNLILSPVVWLCIFAFSGYYQQPYFKSHLEELQTTAVSALLGSLLFFFSIVIDDVPLIDDQLMGLMKIVKVSPRTYLQILLTMFSCIFFPVFLGRYFITHQANDKIRRGTLGLRTLLIGNGKAAATLLKELAAQRRQNGYIIIGNVSTGHEKSTRKLPVENLGDFADIDSIVRKYDIEAFLLAPDLREPRIIYRQVYDLLPYDCPIRLKANAEEILTGQVRTNSLTTIPMQEFGSVYLTPFQRNLKRAADITASVIALTLLSPLMLFLCILIPLNSPGSVFYSQERVGRLGKKFKMYKFRSMKRDAEAKGPQLASTDDVRITSIGHTLRKYRLDELPQFWNVLKGEMSLVGPRPEREHYIRQIMEIAPYYSRLLQLRPGITSWGMVKYGYASDVFQMVERMRYDLMYIDNYSAMVDLKIVGYTIKTVLTGKGI